MASISLRVNIVKLGTVKTLKVSAGSASRTRIRTRARRIFRCVFFFFLDLLLYIQMKKINGMCESAALTTWFKGNGCGPCVVWHEFVVQY